MSEPSSATSFNLSCFASIYAALLLVFSNELWLTVSTSKCSVRLSKSCSFLTSTLKGVIAVLWSWAFSEIGDPINACKKAARASLEDGAVVCQSRTRAKQKKKKKRRDRHPPLKSPKISSRVSMIPESRSSELVMLSNASPSKYPASSFKYERP